MANTPSAIKRMKQSERQRVRNRAIRSHVRSTVKTARAAADAPGTDASAAILGAMRALDKAVSKGVIHRNTAARRKSSLARKLN